MITIVVVVVLITILFESVFFFPPEIYYTAPDHLSSCCCTYIHNLYIISRPQQLYLLLLLFMSAAGRVVLRCLGVSTAHTLKKQRDTPRPRDYVQFILEPAAAVCGFASYNLSTGHNPLRVLGARGWFSSPPDLKPAAAAAAAAVGEFSVFLYFFFFPQPSAVFPRPSPADGIQDRGRATPSSRVIDSCRPPPHHGQHRGELVGGTGTKLVPSGRGPQHAAGVRQTEPSAIR